MLPETFHPTVALIPLFVDILDAESRLQIHEYHYYLGLAYAISGCLVRPNLG